ncbi:MAG: hypothetical protein LBQ08_04275 [Holosporaceae bacterium]|jgi:type VI secretion system protein ImpL|nr:hypothetical protein [Holosporaceae bacterium]
MGIKELLAEKISYIPKELISIISFGLIAIALILIIIFFMICVAYINSKQNSAADKDDQKNDKKSDPVTEKVRHEDLPIISGRMGEILSLLGILNAGAITKIFFKVLEVMKNSTYDINWRYKLPCLMIVGPDGSGKSTLLKSLNFEHLTADGSSMDSMWKLFKNGAIFELPRIDLSEDDDTFWSFISELFVFIKPRRPLDGIIVTLPADMLLSETMDIEKHSREIFGKIFKFQKDINFHMPIYLVVTKMDLIPGFAEFAHLLNNNVKQQIFGWSCPYSINSALSVGWIEEIFQTVNDGIRKGVLHFSREKQVSADLEKAVLFEYNISKIKSNLTKYLHSMFHSHNPEDGLLLRGVYFVGKQKQVDLSSSDIMSPVALSPNTNSVFNYSCNNDLYFAQDLFKEKIFKEYNIAYPIRVDAVDMSKVEQRNKIIMATGSAVIALGWFWGNNLIREKIHEYYLSMASVKTTMTKIKYLEANLKIEEDKILINKQTATLLKNLPSVKRSDITSVFVPQSWFSNLHKEIIETIGLVFDSVVIRAMYIDINLDTKSILQKAAEDSLSLERKKDLFDVNSFASFKKLREFTEQISNIEKVSAEYNSVRQLEDRKSVADLTTILFKENFGIADEIKGRIPNKKLIPPKFDITLFRSKIEASLRAVFMAFLRDVLDVTVEKILQNLSMDVEKIIDASQNASSSYSAKDLARVYNKAVLISDILKNKNFSWISKEHFIPCSEYVELMNRLGVSNAINKDCIKDLLKIGELEFHKFKSRLLVYKTDLTGELLSSDIRAVSTGFDNFQKEIRALLDQPFICTTANGKLNTTILEDKMLIWDIKRLKELSGLIDKYYEFTENMPKDMRAQHFELYKMIARKCFYSIVESILGSAQIFDDMPLGHSKDLLEDAYKRQALNIRNASFAIPKIAKILDEMQEEDSLKDFGFSAMVASHYSALLERVDALFNQETPYSAGHAALDNWNGDKSQKSSGISDHSEMKQYLTAQFERIRFLAKDIASPIVDLLSMPHLIDKVKNQGILSKWKEIIVSVDDYENKKPGNSIAALESFISDSLSKVSSGSFDEQGEIKTLSESGGDYFLSKRSNVAKSLLSRTEIIQYEKAADFYNKIHEFFNNNLAHKFPFGISDQDASLKDIENYVNLYEQNSKNITDVLERNKDKKQINEKAIEFLKLMSNRIIPFLKTWIAHSKTSDANSALVTFNIQMRPSPDLEALTSSIVDREILIDNSKVADNSNGVFFNNNSVNVVFNWVSSSDEKPNEKSASGNLLIQGRTATFAYAGKWALFRLIEENKTNKESESPNGVLLQFNVPIVDASKGDVALASKMIVKITPMKKDGDKTSPLEWPIFPELCPDLHNNVQNTADISPVSSTGMDVNVSFDGQVQSTGSGQ